jgi:hypothetical protein
MSHQKINLSWDSKTKAFTATSNLKERNLESDNKGSSGGAKPAAIPMSKIQVHPGDTLEWSYNTGDITDFVIHLTPADGFDPPIYWKGAEPVKVVKDFGPDGHAYCGFVSGGILYGYPKNNDYGHSTPDGN